VTVPLASDRPTVTVREAAEALGVSAAGLYRAVKAGTSPVEVVRVGARIVVPTASLRQILRLDESVGQGTAAALHVVDGVEPAPGRAHDAA
jgi:hypothetical protein